MIHFRPEGGYVKLGLNLFPAKGGCIAMWRWFDFETHEATSYRLRMRLHMSPRLLWSVERTNVIDYYLEARNCALINREELNDLKAAETQLKSVNELASVIKPV